MQFATLHVGRTAYVLAFLFSFFGVSLSHADSLTLLWDANQGTVNGYAVYVGSSRVDVGNTTSYTMTTAVAGQRYCFAVSAYNAKGEGPKSGQVCGYSNESPTLTSPGNQSSRVGQAIGLQLAGNDPDGLPITYTATGLPPGLFVGSATGFISGTLTTAGSYSVTARVSDGVLQSSPVTFAWSVTTGTTSSDTTQPTVSIVTPTTGTSFTSSSSALQVAGTASDNVGVRSVTWSNSRGGSGTASGTTTWSVPSIGLQVGSNVITVAATDAAGNTGTDVLTVTYSSTTSSSTGWTFCAREGGTCAFTGTRQVRYGGNGLYAYKTLSSSTACTNAVFGDPAPGYAKQCDFGSTSTSTPSSPSNWTFCAREGGTCAFTGTQQVRYGANGLYAYKTLSSSTACTNAVFGDPAPGYAKQCDYGSTSSSTSSWSVCAAEGGVCAFTGTQQVRYGGNGSYTYKTLSGGTACTNAVFGDPAPGVAKQCSIGATSLVSN